MQETQTQTQPELWQHYNHVQDLTQWSFDGAYGLRHALSIPNQNGIILSDPASGVKPEFGLTDEGREKINREAERFKQKVKGDDVDILIVTSPFSRCREGAEVFQRVLDADLRVDLRLRERFFGELEGTSAEIYDKVWRIDALDPSHTRFGVESTEAVLSRMTQVLMDLHLEFAEKSEREPDRKSIIILSSHGDPLQIALNGVQKISPGHHRYQEPIQNNEMRQFVLADADGW